MGSKPWQTVLQETGAASPCALQEQVTHTAHQLWQVGYIKLSFTVDMQYLDYTFTQTTSALYVNCMHVTRGFSHCLNPFIMTPGYSKDSTIIFFGTTLDNYRSVADKQNKPFYPVLQNCRVCDCQEDTLSEALDNQSGTPHAACKLSFRFRNLREHKAKRQLITKMARLRVSTLLLILGRCGEACSTSHTTGAPWATQTACMMTTTHYMPTFSHTEISTHRV